MRGDRRINYLDGDNLFAMYTYIYHLHTLNVLQFCQLYFNKAEKFMN